MTFSEFITHQSKSCPGVTVSLRRIGFTRRIDIDTATLPWRKRRRELEFDFPPYTKRELELQDQVEVAERKAISVSANEAEFVIEQELIPLQMELAAESTMEVKKQRETINLEYALLEGYIRVETIKASVVSISGGDLDGMTVDQLLDFGPPALVREIYAAIDTDSKLGGKEAKNSQSLTNSGALDKATPESTNAPSAEAALVGTT